jgi:hypothetical protein
MSDGTITREDLREALRDMSAQMNRGFDGINDRLDTLNGKTDRHGSALAVHEERWQRLDRATSTGHLASGSAEAPTTDWKTLSMVGALATGALAGLVSGVIKAFQMVTGK